MYRWWISGVACLLSLAGASAASLDCTQCEAWNKEQAPFRIFGNTYYVGPRGLSSVLITSAAGHVLIDGALPQSAPLIARHVEQLGQLPAYPGSGNVEALGKRKSVVLGALQLNVIHTPGHTPGGTSWTWKSCEDERCLTIVYGDSLSAISDDSFKYSGDPRYPNAAADVLGSIAALDAAPCDILIAAHPDLSPLWSAVDEHGKGDRARLVDSSACKRYAAAGKARFDKLLESEGQ